MQMQFVGEDEARLAPRLLSCLVAAARLEQCRHVVASVHGEGRGVCAFYKEISAMDFRVHTAPVKEVSGTCTATAPTQPGNHPQPVSVSPVHAWPNHNSGPVLTGVLVISGMPRTLRPAIEEAMYECLRSESEFIVPGEDPLSAQWCTRWFRDRPSLESLAAGKPRGCSSSSQAGEAASTSAAGLGCHQVLTGTAQELSSLESAVGELARTHGFSAALRQA